MGKFKLLLMLIFLMKLHVAQALKCTKCIGGNLAMPEKYGWKSAWKMHNCHLRKFTIVNCALSCLTIIFEKESKDKQGYNYNGMMMGCSEHMHDKTSDLPKEVDSDFYSGDITANLIDGPYNITFFLSTHSVQGVDGIADLPLKTKPTIIRKKYFYHKLDLISWLFLGGFSIFILIFIWIIVNGYCALLMNWCRKIRAPRQNLERVVVLPSIAIKKKKYPSISSITTSTSSFELVFMEKKSPSISSYLSAKSFFEEVLI